MAVKCAGWFVCEHYVGVIDQRPCDSRSLHLPTGELVWFLLDLVEKVYSGQGSAGPVLTFGWRHARKRQSDFYILQYGLMVDEVVVLEDKTNRAVSIGISVCIFELGC